MAAAASSVQRPVDFFDFVRLETPDIGDEWQRFLFDNPLAAAEAAKFDEFRKRHDVALSPHATGGSCKIYKATDRVLKREVALKFNTDADEANFKDLVVEGDTLRQLSGCEPHIPAFHGSCAIAPFREAIVMDFCPGQNLYERFIKTGISQTFPVLEWDVYINMLIQAQKINHMVQSRRVGNRDIKPENYVFDDATGILRLVDFGLGRNCDREKSIELACSRFYRPPEVTLGLPQTPAIDTYSTSVAFVELGTKKHLFHTLGSDGEFSTHLKHMGQYIRVIGKNPPRWMIEASPLASKFFSKVQAGKYVCCDAGSGEVMKLKDRLQSDLQSKWPTVPAERIAPVNKLLRKQLRADPARRPAPKASFNCKAFDPYLYLEVIVADDAVDLNYLVLSQADAKPLKLFDIKNRRRVHHTLSRAEHDKYRLQLIGADGKIVYDEPADVPKRAQITIVGGKPVVTEITLTSSESKEEKKKS